MTTRPVLFTMITFIFMNSFMFSIAEISNNKIAQDNIENTEIKEQSWFEKNKVACIIAGGIVSFTLAAMHLYLQIFFLKEYMKQEKEKSLWEDKMLATCKEGFKVQDEQYTMQKDQYWVQLNQYLTQLGQFAIERKLSHTEITLNKLEKLEKNKA